MQNTERTTKTQVKRGKHSYLSLVQPRETKNTPQKSEQKQKTVENYKKTSNITKGKNKTLGRSTKNSNQKTARAHHWKPLSHRPATLLQVQLHDVLPCAPPGAAWGEGFGFSKVEVFKFSPGFSLFVWFG